MEKFNEILSRIKVESLLLQTHTSLCSQSTIDQKNDSSQPYDLSNHAKLPVKREINEQL